MDGNPSSSIEKKSCGSSEGRDANNNGHGIKLLLPVGAAKSDIGGVTLLMRPWYVTCMDIISISGTNMGVAAADRMSWDTVTCPCSSNGHFRLTRSDKYLI